MGKPAAMTDTTSRARLDVALRRRENMTGIGKLMAGAALATLFAAGTAWAEGDTIKVGVLHSLSGTMAISETTLKDT